MTKTRDKNIMNLCIDVVYVYHIRLSYIAQNTIFFYFFVSFQVYLLNALQICDTTEISNEMFVKSAHSINHVVEEAHFRYKTLCKD